MAAAIEHEAALKPLALATLIDIGANRGQFSTLALGLFPEITIHAFEPLSEAVAVYKKVFEHCPRVRLYPVAAGELPGISEIHLSAQEDSSSLLPITEAQSKIFPGTHGVGTREIEVCRVDDVLGVADLPSPLMVKLDVQGFELTALKGMLRTLDRADYVYAEITFIPLYKGQALAHEVIGWLKERGFFLSGIYNLATSSKGRVVQADALFERARL